MAKIKVESVPGHNNATYGPIPKDLQLFNAEFLDIAPTPIIADRVFFIYLRGWMPSPKAPSAEAAGNVKHSSSDPDPDLNPGLTNATLKIRSTVTYPDGSSDVHESLTIPFKSMVFNGAAHMVIRDESGKQVECLPGVGRGDVLLDFQIPNLFLRSGMWRFGVEARIAMGDGYGDRNGDGCLFAFELVQWLEGGLR
ncbi:hypothetical protein IFR05_014050 [Cadophora sp. M221]|nr:hypothetical protein IFR05_014050 [Cadophora sp. M221]